MLTRKAKYGLKALVYLAQQPPDKFVMINEIAQARSISRKFLEAIMGELREAGFLSSRKGKMGGYRLASDAREIKIGSVIRVLDGTLAPIPCASRSQFVACVDCDLEKCEVRRLMLEVRQAICDVLDHRSLWDMRAQAELAALLDIPCPE